MNQNLQNIRNLSAMKLAGRHASETLIKRIINYNNIQPKGVGNKNSLTYDVDEVEEAIRNHYSKKKPANPNTSATLIELKEEKIRREIEQIKADVEKKELQIEQLKLRLIDYDEALTYFIKFKSAVSGILRKQFLSQMPIEVTGLDPAKAREKGEEMYNQVMEVISQGIEGWKEEFTKDETEQTTTKSDKGE